MVFNIWKHFCFETLEFQQKYLIVCENHWNRTFLKSDDHYTIIMQKTRKDFFGSQNCSNWFCLMSKFIDFLFKRKFKVHTFQILSCARRRAHMRAPISLWKKFQKISKKVNCRVRFFAFLIKMEFQRSTTKNLWKHFCFETFEFVEKFL